jgi:hypothetical protein
MLLSKSIDNPMTIVNFPKKRPNEPPFFNDIQRDGYHVYSLENTKTPNFYPPELPDYLGVALKDLKEDDTITIRVFFGIGKGKKMRVDGGHINLKVEFVDEDSVMAVITTQLPDHFAMKTGESLEIFEEEILYKVDSQ